MKRLPRKLKKKVKARFKHRYGYKYPKGLNLLKMYVWLFKNPLKWDMTQTIY